MIITRIPQETVVDQRAKRDNHQDRMVQPAKVVWGSKRSSGCYRVIEAAKIEFPTYPKMAHGMREWKTELTRSVNTAAGRRDDKAWAWILRAMNEKIDLESLGESRPKVRIIGQNAGISAVCNVAKGALENQS